MKNYFYKVRSLVVSATAKDTYILFVGNGLSAFLGFLFTLLVARALTVSDFGVLSATINLIIIITSLADIGISSGAVNFIAENESKGDFKKANEYIKASAVVRLIVVLAISVIVVLFAPFISRTLLATQDSTMAVWAAIVPIFLFPNMLFPFILQAKRKFLKSVIYDNTFYLARLAFVFFYYLAGVLTVPKAFWAYGVGFLANIILTLLFMGKGFIFSKPSKKEYKSLLKFSGWIGVNRIISSVSGRIDVQMLAAMSGAVVTGLYSIPSKLASFVVVLASSYSAVLATRLAGFGDRDKEKKYILKATLALLPITLGIIIWIAIAKPFVLILFGEKYADAVPVFQVLLASQIPFILTAPAVAAIIYAIKKTIYIGVFSFFQIAAIFILNLYLIPKYGFYGPTITYGITNTILAIYVWSIVIKNYWQVNKQR